MKIVKMNHKNKGFEISVDYTGKIKLLADKCYDVMKDCENYIELHMKHKSGEEFVFTMQKKKNLTPSEYRRLLEDEILKLKEQIK